jgi:hypothetical protein
MTETIEQAAERYAKNKSSSDVFRQAHIEDFKAGWNARDSQPNPHRITLDQFLQVEFLKDTGNITQVRMVEILNEIAAGKHKERIEI